MKTRNLSSLLILLIACQVGLGRPPLDRSSHHRNLKLHYVLVDLEPLGLRPPSVGYKVNESGQITGWRFDLEGASHAFMFDGTTVRYPVSSSDNTQGLDINGLGQAVGQVFEEDWRAGFLYAQGQTFPLSFWAFGINDSGVIVGCVPSSEASKAVISSNGVVTVLGWGRAAAINEAGQIVGNDGHQAVMFTATNLVMLGTLPGGLYSDAYRINQQGHVVGWSYQQGLGYRGFIYRDGSMSDLGVLPGHASSFAYDINGADEVVGESFADANHPIAVLWTEGIIYDLNDLVRAERGYVLEKAYGINDMGQIVGSASYNGQWRAFLLNPVQRPRH